MAGRRWRTRRRQDVAELNITAFMNLMVILVPFLLITAVFSRLSILELDLPSADAAAAEPEAPKFSLEITVRDAVIEVGDRSAGLLRRFQAGDDGHDLAGLGDYLLDVKRSFPDELDATLLL